MPRFASVALVDPRGWILLQERDEFPVIDPEKWGFPGGHLEDGEDFEYAAYRELAEETGVELTAGLELFGHFTVRHGNRDDEFELWAASTDLADSDIECREGRRIVFVDPEVATGLPLTVAAAQVLPAFLASDTYRSLAVRHG